MSIWQTKNWQEMLKKSWQVEDYYIVDNVYIEKRSIWLWHFWMFAIWVDLLDIQTSTYKKAIELSKDKNCLFMQFETLHYWTKINSSFNNIKSWYYKKFITPYTAVIDLSLSEDKILSKMKPKGRYNIRLASKKWVEVFDMEKNDKNISTFYDLMLETTSRDWFNANNLDYYKTFLNTINESKLLFAYYEWKVIAAGIFTFTNIAIYYYWASTSDRQYRNIMAPYLLQWEAIKIGKDKWCRFYDFLWVSTPWDKNSSLVWVTDFKLKLSKDVRNVSESYIYINNKIKYYLLQLIRKIKHN